MTASAPDPHTQDYTGGFPGANLGVLPVLTPELTGKDPRQNAATAASAAGVRAFSAQVIAFYFRAPVKAFFRTRVDYLAYARNLQQHNHSYGSPSTSSLLGAVAAPSNNTKGSAAAGTSQRPQTWTQWMGSMARGSSPGVLASAVKHYGWRVIPDQILPPLIANVGVGAVLYTSYLTILGQLHPESGRATKRVYPPPLPTETFTAGFLAGSLQSLVAAPLDAIQSRFERSGGQGPGLIDEKSGRPRSMWAFSYEKLREIGMRGIFAGWGLSLAKDSLGSGIFFGTFEYVKAQGFYSFVAWYYGSLSEDMVDLLSRVRPVKDKDKRVGIQGTETTLRPHYAMEPAFLLLAGMSASIAQQFVIHPLNHIQVQHWEHLEDLDGKARRIRQDAQQASQGAGANNTSKQRWRMLKEYYHAYQETWAQICAQASAQEGNGPNAVRRWLYRGFWWTAIRQVPSTSAGLVIFELVRRKYGLGGEPIRINKDGYDILLS